MFPSVSGNKYFTAGKYYYEVMLRQEGSGKMVAQIGWATPGFKPDEFKGAGVGDDPFSFAYDGGRVRKWHNGRWSAYGDSQKWASEDIIGCAVDLDAKEIEFYLNGEPLGVAFEGFDCVGGVTPAASFRVDQELDFNFGQRPFEYPVPGYQPLEQQQLDPNSPLSLPAFDTYARNYKIIDCLYKRENLPPSVIQVLALF